MRFKYLKKFFDWCLEEGPLSCGHPLAGLKKRRPVGRIVHIETDTLADLLRLPDGRTFTGLRDMMGHANLSTTQKYLALTLDDLRKAHAGSSLVNEVAPRRHRGEPGPLQPSSF